MNDRNKHLGIARGVGAFRHLIGATATLVSP